MDTKGEIESKSTVAFLGPPATFSHMACLQYFGNSVTLMPENTIQDVFEAVESERADYGMVPVENSTEGPISLTLDSFVQSGVKICAEVMIRISQDLISLSGDAWDMKKIYSHPQALSQCRDWLRTNFPHVPLEEAGSTARAAQMAKEDSRAAAIAGSLAASLYGLKAVASQIEDQPNNYTRFLVLRRQGGERTGKDKTSVLFIVSHAPGTLFRVLQVFYEKKINLTKIESRPNRGKSWEYVFFIDFEGHAVDPHVAQALQEVKERVLFLKLLGSYPQSSLEK